MIKVWQKSLILKLPFHRFPSPHCSGIQFLFLFSNQSIDILIDLHLSPILLKRVFLKILFYLFTSSFSLSILFLSTSISIHSYTGYSTLLSLIFSQNQPNSLTHSLRISNQDYISRWSKRNLIKLTASKPYIFLRSLFSFLFFVCVCDFLREICYSTQRF